MQSQFSILFSGFSIGAEIEREKLLLVFASALPMRRSQRVLTPTFDGNFLVLRLWALRDRRTTIKSVSLINGLRTQIRVDVQRTFRT